MFSVQYRIEASQLCHLVHFQNPSCRHNAAKRRSVSWRIWVTRRSSKKEHYLTVQLSRDAKCLEFVSTSFELVVVLTRKPWILHFFKNTLNYWSYESISNSLQLTQKRSWASIILLKLSLQTQRPTINQIRRWNVWDVYYRVIKKMRILRFFSKIFKFFNFHALGAYVL